MCGSDKRLSVYTIYPPRVRLVFETADGVASVGATIAMPSRIATPFPTVPCASVWRTRFRLQPFCRPSIVLTSIGSVLAP